MIEVTLKAVQISLVSSDRIAILKEIGSERHLPIWIGPCEAEAISRGAKDVKVLRPMTHDLIVNLLEVLGAELSYIFVNDLANRTFYATLVLETDGMEIEIDSRPSDAIAIAVRLGVPIYVAESVMDEAGVVPERDILKQDTSDEEDLNVFRDFLSSLDQADAQDS
jgi:bifunctional DNase/RNase